MTELKSVEQHYQDVMQIGSCMTTEYRDIESARGLSLSEDLHARLDIPRFTNSAMDGFAVRAAEVAIGKKIPVVGDIAAGSASQTVLAAGSAMRIMTGAPIPEGADSVLIVEHTENAVANMLATPPEYIVPTHVPNVGAHIRRAGEEVKAGSLMFPAGTVLTPERIGVVASLGYARVPVHRRVRVGVLATGSELHNPEAQLRDGEIPDSNSYFVAALVEEYGADVERISASSDDVTSFVEIFDRLVDTCDLVITTGGVSAGAYDVVKAALRERDVAFHKVRMQPGKPQGFGVVRGTPVVCFPGNPISVYVSMQLFGLPLLRKIQGRPTQDFGSRFTDAMAGTSWRHKTGRTQFLPAVKTDHGVVPVGMRSEKPLEPAEKPVEPAQKATGKDAQKELSSPLPRFSALPQADVLAVIPHDVAHVSRGMLLKVVDLRP